MVKDVGRIAAFGILSALCGCNGPGLYRSIGNIPGVAFTDYAFTFYCGTASQLFQFPPPQAESSMIEALGDLGFRVLEPPIHKDGECLIKAQAPDGRPTRITIAPQNAMALVKVLIGPDHLGDYELSRDLLRRVALNFGAGMRAYTPPDLTVPRKLVPPTVMPRATPPPPPEYLQGEGLRPEGDEKATSSDEITVPGAVVPPVMTSPGMMGGFMPTMAYPNSPYMPYAPWPYSPYTDGQQ